MELNNFEDALLNLNMCLELDPGHEEAGYLKAKLLIKLSRYDQAVDSLD